MKYDLKDLVPIKYPIVQAPMLGVTTPGMVAAVSNAGGLGSLPLGGLAPDKARMLIRQTRQATNRPFAVNLFAHPLASSAVDTDQIKKMEDLLHSIYSTYGLNFERKRLEDYQFYNHTHLLELLLEEQVSIVSFTFGLLEAESTQILKEKGVTLIGTATSVKEALLLEKSGVDALVAQGFEAGGHRGTFLESEPLPQVGLISLLPQIVDQVSIPVIAAGGLFDHRSVKAVFALGAAAAQLGTYFIAADESAASQGYKDMLLKSDETSTQLTRAFTGRWARGIKNLLMEQLEQSGLAFPAYTYQNSLTSGLREFGKTNNLPELLSLWAGQSAAKTSYGNTSQLFKDLINKIQNDTNPIF